MIDRICTK